MSGEKYMRSYNICVYIYIYVCGCIHIHPHTHTHIFNELLLIHKKEGNSATCNNMDGPEGIILSDVSQTEKEKYCMISFICGIRKIWTNSRMVVSRGWE